MSITKHNWKHATSVTNYDRSVLSSISIKDRHEEKKKPKRKRKLPVASNREASKVEKNDTNEPTTYYYDGPIPL